MTKFYARRITSSDDTKPLLTPNPSFWQYSASVNPPTLTVLYFPQTQTVEVLSPFLCLSRVSLTLNPLNAELNPICYLLALLGAHHFLHVSRIRDKSLTLRQLMSYIYIYIYIYIYGAPILDVSRSHTTTQHSR